MAKEIIFAIIGFLAFLAVLLIGLSIFKIFFPYSMASFILFWIIFLWIFEWASWNN
jgi:hypothetical protein